MPLDPDDVRVELSHDDATSRAPSKPSMVGRPWLSVMFDCCRVYQRVYRNAAGDRYSGRCPKCGRSVGFRVGHGGVTARSFRAS